jgi:hypothetical protein
MPGSQIFSLLLEIYQRLTGLQSFLGGITHILRRDGVKEELRSLQGRLQEFDQRFTVRIPDFTYRNYSHTPQFVRLASLEMNVARIASGLSTQPLEPKYRDHGFTSPPPPCAIFTGREEILVQMERHLLPADGSEFAKQLVFVLVGLGGAGKTQIALKYVDRHNIRYESPSLSHFVTSI